MYLKEKDMSRFMDRLYKKDPNWLNLHTDLREIFLKHSDIYSTINNNFDSAYLYLLMEKKVDTKQFRQVYDKIQSRSDDFTMKKIYRNFFDVNDASYHLLKAIDPDHSIYDNHFIFLASDKPALKNEEYLQVLMEGSKNPKNFNDINFWDFVSLLVASPQDIEKIYSYSSKNALYSNMNYYHGYETFADCLLTIISQHRNIPCVQQCITLLKNTIPDFQALFSNLLFNDRSTSTHSHFYAQIKSNFFKLAENANLPTFDMLCDRYAEAYLSKKTDYFDENIAWGWAKSINSFFQSYDGPNHLRFDISAMDGSKDLSENYLYIKYLELSIQKDIAVELSPQHRAYLQTSINTYKNHPHASTTLDFPLINAYLQNIHLEESLEDKSSPLRKMKI